MKITLEIDPKNIPSLKDDEQCTNRSPSDIEAKTIIDTISMLSKLTKPSRVIVFQMIHSYIHSDALFVRDNFRNTANLLKDVAFAMDDEIKRMTLSAQADKEHVSTDNIAKLK